MSDFGKSVKKMSVSYDNLMNKNKNVKIAVIGLLILYTILVVPLLSQEQLQFLNNNVMRIVAILLISLLCLVDPVLSLVLAICFVVTLNRLNVLKNKQNNVENTQDHVNLNLLNKNANLNSNVNLDSNLQNNNLNSNLLNNKPNNDGLLNDTDMDINNNVVNNNVVNNAVNNNNALNNNVVNNAANNNAVNNNALNNNVLNNAANNVPAVNNKVVNNNLLNNSSLVNNNNPNNLDYLNDKMNVLTNKDNSSANIVGPNNRQVRNSNKNVPGFDNVGNVHNLGSHLLMNGTNGYNLEKKNHLSGKYNNSIMADNSSSLTGSPVPKSNNNTNNRNNFQNKNNLNNVSGYNKNNLVTKNPYPGNNVNFQVEPQKAELNVPGYNNTEYEQLTIRNNNNNVVENLKIVQESFQNRRPREGREGFQNRLREGIKGREGFQNRRPRREEFQGARRTQPQPQPQPQPQASQRQLEGFQNRRPREGFQNARNTRRKREGFQNNVSEMNSLNNLIKLDGVTNNNNEENMINVLNQSNQQRVGNNNQVQIKNILNNNIENVEKLPQSILFTSPKQLKDAQDRSVYCEGTKNNEPILSASNSHSAQGYKLPGNINGYNQYGADAINYLCVSDNC